MAARGIPRNDIAIIHDHPAQVRCLIWAVPVHGHKVIRTAAVHDYPLGTSGEVKPSPGYRNVGIGWVIDIYTNVHVRQWYTTRPCFPARSCQ